MKHSASDTQHRRTQILMGLHSRLQRRLRDLTTSCAGSRVCASYNSPILSIVTHMDTVGVIYVRALSGPRAGLDLEIIACETDRKAAESSVTHGT
jgi:hypothetical protein